MGLLQSTSPHDFQRNSTRFIMTEVLLALTPGVIVLCSFFGSGTLINLALALPLALLLEAFALWLRQRPIRLFVFDGSALVTAALLAIALPPTTPWWLLLTGLFVAIVIAKHLYGGLGQNPFNPAMVAYVVLLIAFPVEMTRWLPPIHEANHELLHSFTGAWHNFLGTLNLVSAEPINFDAYTAATPLDALKTARGQLLTPDEAAAFYPSLGFSGDRFIAIGWLWANLAFLLGGFYLLFRKLISWHIPVSFLTALALCAFIGALFNPLNGGALFHLFSGASMLGAFFIATDPVSAATSNSGKLIYGAAIGGLTYLIRTLGGYPDAIAFAVLLMNLATPTIDYYTRPRTYGHSQAKSGWRNS